MKVKKVIAHRGNLHGLDGMENQPNQIKRVLKMGFEAEIDVWKEDKRFLLGHDKGVEQIEFDFLLQPGLWCHAKNLEAFEAMLEHPIINCFWHEEDQCTLTSHGYIWTFPEKQITSKSVLVDLDRQWYKKDGECFAVCTDYPSM